MVAKTEMTNDKEPKNHKLQTIQVNNYISGWSHIVNESD